MWGPSYPQVLDAIEVIKSLQSEQHFGMAAYFFCYDRLTPIFQRWGLSSLTPLVAIPARPVRTWTCMRCVLLGGQVKGGRTGVQLALLGAAVVLR